MKSQENTENDSTDITLRGLEWLTPLGLTENVDRSRNLLYERDAVVAVVGLVSASRTRSNAFHAMARRPGAFAALSDRLEAWEEVLKKGELAPVPLSVVSESLQGWRRPPESVQEIVSRGMDVLGRISEREPRLQGESSNSWLNRALENFDRNVLEKLEPVTSNARFQRLRRAVSGLHGLLQRLTADMPVRVKILHVSWKNMTPESLENLRSRIAQEAEASERGCIVVGDELTSDEDASTVLREICAAGAGIGFPVVIGASPGLLGCKTWEELDSEDEPHEQIDRSPIARLLKKVGSDRLVCVLPPSKPDDAAGMARPHPAHFPYVAYPMAMFGPDESPVNSAYLFAEKVVRAFWATGGGDSWSGLLRVVVNEDEARWVTIGDRASDRLKKIGFVSLPTSGAKILIGE